MKILGFVQKEKQIRIEAVEMHFQKVLTLRQMLNHKYTVV
jgi:hypothetical protein